MKTKICTNPKCKQPTKPVSEFSKDKYARVGFKSRCKECVKEYSEKNKEKNLKHHRKFPWKRILKSIKQRCENPKNKDYPHYGGRGIENRITVEEIEKLWYRDKAWLLDQPSIDRKENNKNYTFKNCRFIELSENIAKDCSKKVLQFDLQGIFIKEWVSMSKAGRELNIASGSISRCCSNILKTSGGFIWRFK